MRAKPDRQHKTRQTRSQDNKKQGIAVASGGREEKKKEKRTTEAAPSLSAAPHKRAKAARTRRRACSVGGMDFSTRKSCTERKDFEESLMKRAQRLAQRRGLCTPGCVSERGNEGNGDNSSWKPECGLMRLRRMSCEFNFKPPTVGKKKKKKNGGGGDSQCRMRCTLGGKKKGGREREGV